MKSIIIYILFIVCGCLSIHVWANWGREAHSSPLVAIRKVRAPMSVRELQSFLNAQGNSRYDCGKEDGKRGPKLYKAWDNYICDRYAKAEFE